MRFFSENLIRISLEIENADKKEKVRIKLNKENRLIFMNRMKYKTEGFLTR